MSFLQRLFGETRQRAALEPLYRALVDYGRDPAWYRQGQVRDTLEGRFDMIAAVIALALLRLEAEGEEGKGPSVLLTEVFIEDMDGTLRQIGIGDYVVGKHVGRLVGALGGRLGAFRQGRAMGDIKEAVRRNIFRSDPPSAEALEFVAARLEAFGRALDVTPVETLFEGKLPRP